MIPGPTTRRIVEEARDVYRWTSGIFQGKAGRAARTHMAPSQTKVKCSG